MYIKTFVTVAVISALPLNVASAGSVILGGYRPADIANVRQYLVSGGWIMGWLSAANRGNKADWLENVRPEHVVDLIDKYCRGDATVEQAGLALQLSFMKVSESMGNHNSEIVDASSVD